MMKQSQIPHDNSHIHVQGVDMSPEAISRRWEQLSRLYCLAKALRENDFLQSLSPEARHKLRQL